MQLDSCTYTEQIVDTKEIVIFTIDLCKYISSFTDVS